VPAPVIVSTVSSVQKNETQRSRPFIQLLRLSTLALSLLNSIHARAIEPCRINVIDEASSWPVPLVEFTTAHNVRFVSDNAGVIAFDLPPLTIFTQYHGKSSFLGELWYAEANSPLGPWNDARHVVMHAMYTFYNPLLHAEFTSPDSPVLFFEATYTKTFSATPDGTPRHDYNQVLYRLDLDELIK
jgi:hypothetical protein